MTPPDAAADRAALHDVAAGTPEADHAAADQAVSDQAVSDQAGTITGLTDLLVKAVRALGAAGEADQASRIAAKAWWVLKDWPRQAERVNGTMHYLARLPDRPSAPSGVPSGAPSEQ